MAALLHPSDPSTPSVHFCCPASFLSLSLSLPPSHTPPPATSPPFINRYLDLNGKRVRLEIWDTAGQERFRTITTSYIRGAEGVMLCYDVTNRESFTAVDNWMKEIEKVRGWQQLCPMV